MRCWVIGCEVMHRAMWQDVELSNEAEYVDGIESLENWNSRSI